MSSLFRRILVYGLGIVAMLTFFSAILTYEWLRSNGPRKPNFAAGQIYPMRMQQPFDVYLTKFQNEWIQCGPTIGVALGIFAALLNGQWKVVRNPQDGLPKKFY